MPIERYLSFCLYHIDLWSYWYWKKCVALYLGAFENAVTIKKYDSSYDFNKVQIRGGNQTELKKCNVTDIYVGSLLLKTLWFKLSLSCVSLCLFFITHVFLSCLNLLFFYILLSGFEIVTESSQNGICSAERLHFGSAMQGRPILEAHWVRNTGNWINFFIFSIFYFFIKND